MVVKINIKMKETVARYRVLYTSRVMWIPPFLGDSDLTYQPGAAELGGDVNNPSHRLAPGSLVCQMGLGIASWYTILLHQDGNASSTVPTEPTPFPGKYRPHYHINNYFKIQVMRDKSKTCFLSMFS